MKVIYVGGGAASLLSSIYLKLRHPNVDVLILEKNKVLGKKLKATGNGKCNILPINESLDVYNNAHFLNASISNLSLNDLITAFKNIGINIKKISNYGYYPVSESANNVVNLLISKLHELGIKYELDTKVLDYKVDNKVTILTDKGKYFADKLIFSTGGCAAKNLGGDDSLFTVFKNHGYQVNKLVPVLCPIKIKENVKALFGVRNRAKIRLIDENYNIIKEEIGEIQFKKDGLSGICIFNLTRFINKENYKISINFINHDECDISYEDFVNLSQTNNNYLYSLVTAPIADYIKKISKDLNDEYNNLINLSFNVLETYGFEDSHVSRGGISLENINYDFSSKIENNVYFIGEVLDIDGPCGGYNLRFAFASGLNVKIL